MHLALFIVYFDKCSARTYVAINTYKHVVYIVVLRVFLFGLKIKYNLLLSCSYLQ